VSDETGAGARIETLGPPRAWAMPVIPPEVTEVTDVEGETWRRHAAPSRRLWRSAGEPGMHEVAHEDRMIMEYGPIMEVRYGRA
jgi:hypothetical protein